MTDEPTGQPATPFHDLQAYTDLPRLAGLQLSPDGTRLVVGVSTPDANRTRFRTALWEIDPAGERPARRLTRGATGESSAAFTPAGDLLFTASRPDPARADRSDDADGGTPAPLWFLPAGGGEASVAGTRPGGFADVVVAREAGTIVAASPTLPGSGDGEDDEKRRAARRDRKVSAILHAGTPVRHWDRDLGPDAPRLVAAPSPEPADSRPVTWTDLTPDAGAALQPGGHDVTPDGSTVVAAWAVPIRGGGTRSTLVAIDVATGKRRVLADDPAHEFSSPVISPDGSRVVCIRESITTPADPPRFRLVSVPVEGGEPVEVAPDWDRIPTSASWTPDGALVVTADDEGRAPLFRIEPGAGGDWAGGDSAHGDWAVERLTADDGAYSDVRVSPDGSHVYALRSAIDAPPAPVRLAAGGVGQKPVGLPAPSPAPALPGTLTEITTTAADGTPLRAWLVLPAGASAQAPAPLVLWVHGGPLGSWNAWQWRWNPWLMAAHGYAVLLPDPALSTGYGHAFVERGWGAWGDTPYTDVLDLTDVALTRPDLDATRTAAMGGSFGGYLANWIAGHTDRFAAVVTHASIWALDQFGPTTDAPWYWRREMTPEMAAAHSPHRYADAVVTPMLVIHGDRDYRVPVGEALRLWTDLVSHWGGDPADLPHRYLHYAGENHWILSPQNAVTWYETVFAFLDHHVLGLPWEMPDVLR